MASARPALHLGTMTFAWNQASAAVTDAVAVRFLQRFTKGGHTAIDTARSYARGATEEMLGRALKETALAPPKDVTIATKVNPQLPGGLSDEGIRSQLRACLGALGVGSVEALYLHQPDTEHALAESLSTCDALLKAGLVKQIGLSNYSNEEVLHCIKLCTEKGLTRPVVYQGLYNPLNRRIETELLPTLRQHDMHFVAYNPLAGGFLTGKHTSLSEVAPGRFKDNSNYLERFWKEDHFKALELLQRACNEAGLSLVQATYSWMLLHSALGAGDGVLLGASTFEHLDSNMCACEAAAPLPQAVLQALDEAWGLCQADAFAFWRSHSLDMPGREALHPGATYAVK